MRTKYIEKIAKQLESELYAAICSIMGNDADESELKSLMDAFRISTDKKECIESIKNVLDRHRIEIHYVRDHDAKVGEWTGMVYRVMHCGECAFDIRPILDAGQET